MNKGNLRALGFGFLASAILTGGFAVFFQGQVPIQGIKVSSVLNGAAGNDQELASYKEAMSSLLSEKTSLESTKNQLNESLNNLKEAASKQSSQLASIKKSESTSVSESDSASADETSSDAEISQSAETTTETTETEAPAEVAPATSGTFTVNSGESSLQIAQRLVDEGYLSSTDEFEEIVDTWNLSAILQAGSYEFNSNMGAHAILEALTHGVYYYIP
ncbi:MAG: hypothetical protein Q4B80_06005 [Aerococcaceae bacterium]|nr:hypothetical protein [Aerococcaceae bacterium]